DHPLPVLSGPKLPAFMSGAELPEAQTFFADDYVQQKLFLDGIVTLVDAKHLIMHLDEEKPEGVENEAVEQVAFADRIVLNKCDLVDEAHLEEVEKRIRMINESVKITRTSQSKVDMDFILGIEAFNLDKILEMDDAFLADDQEHQHDDRVTSCGIHVKGEVHQQRLNEWLAWLLKERGVDLFRTKGVLAVQGMKEKFVFQAVHMAFNGAPQKTWAEEEERVCKLTFIGKNLNREEPMAKSPRTIGTLDTELIPPIPRKLARSARAMDATKLEKLNETLAALPVRGDYNLQVRNERVLLVFLADEPAYLKTHQQRLRVALGQAPSPRTTLRLDSAETAQRLMAGGKRAAIGLLAQGKLRLEGDLGQLEELRQELAPHGPSLEQAAEALMSSDTAAKGGLWTRIPEADGAFWSGLRVRWLPNEAADCCMSESCGRAFTLLRRRHHCRGCGRIFCDACAPPRGSPPERRCGRCWSARRGVSGPPAAGLPTPAPMPEPEAPIAKSQSTTELLVEFHVEDALNGVRFWRRGVFGLSLAATAYLVAALRSQERLLLSPFLLLAFFLRRWLLRYAEVGWMCLVILCKVLSARMRCSQRPALAAEAIWALCHKVNARFLFDTVVSLGGFWVKLAQTASVMSALPDAYVEELSKLQDAMPADSLEDVEALLSQELGPKWRERIRLDTGPVLGSATIAQVHRATFLGPEGQELPGVIKVQHRGVEEKLLVDISASVMMGRVLTWLIPHLFSDLSSTIQDTAEMSKAELDFRVEAKSQTLAREKILDAGLDVLVPKVIEEFVTKRVLAMDFVKGVKITEYAGAGVSKQQRTEVLAKLINFYGFTLHGPIFNCDPHPGNLLVEKETGRLCVLDWGQVRQLAQPERFAYAKIFMASMTEDVHLFVEGCKTLGFEFQDMDGKPDPTPIVMINALRFLLRDSRPIAQSRADFVQLEQVFGKLDGETKAIQTGGEQIVKGPLMPLTKTVSLLFEVSSRLDVSLPLMHMFVCHGYPMLLKEMGHGSVQARPSQGSFVLEPSHAAGGASAAPRLAAELLQLLEELHARGRILGAQLCVLDLETGDTLADLALGHCSWLRPVPVTSKTIFNILEISKMFLAFSVLRLVDQKRLQLSTALQDSALGK
ncbi:unnamed protein product, partial [Effrenium voratum]